MSQAMCRVRSATESPRSPSDEGMTFRKRHGPGWTAPAQAFRKRPEAAARDTARNAVHRSRRYPRAYVDRLRPQRQAINPDLGYGRMMTPRQRSCVSLASAMLRLGGSALCCLRRALSCGQLCAAQHCTGCHYTGMNDSGINRDQTSTMQYPRNTLVDGDAARCRRCIPRRVRQ